MTAPAPAEFQLVSVTHLESPAGRAATSLEALQKGIAEAEPAVLFHHVTRLTIRFSNARDLPANDFARWARTALQDPEAAEHLAFAGSPSLAPLEEVRASLIRTLERIPARRRQHEAPEEAAFRFVRAQSVTAPLSAALAEPHDLVTYWPRIDRAALFYHLIEAPVLGPGSARLAEWLRLQGASGLARTAEELAAAGHPLGRLQRDLGSRWRRRLIPNRLVRRLDTSEDRRRAEAHDAIARLAGRLRGAPDRTNHDGADVDPGASPESGEGPDA